MDSSRINISKDTSQLDVQYIHAFLTESYWAKGRTLAEVEKSIKNSECYGCYLDGQQVGFARIVTDGVVMAWLMDVFIDEHMRGTGLGTRLMEYLLADLRAQGISKVALATRDADGFYKKLGFTKPQHPTLGRNI